MKTKLTLMTIAVAASLVVLGTARPAVAGVCPPATITVSNLNDSGSGTLRQAILDANSCPDANTINFNPGLTGTILLTSGELLITDSLSLNGPGVTNVAVNGNASNRVFQIGPGISVTISGLTITNGNSNVGAGIDNNHSTLTVNNCTLSGNSASGGAGGIYNDGSFGSATLEIANTTLSGNSAGSDGGGIYNDGYGGGTGTVVIANSTLSGNSAGGNGGGIYNNGLFGYATLVIANNTISGNSATTSGGGIYNNGFSGSSTLQIGNTILNAGASGGSISNNSSTVTSDGYNVSSDDAGGFLTATGDQINTDPLLGPLQDNGGSTFTHALSAGSPAFNAGDPNFTAPPDFDQRGSGFPRVVGGRIDIGAFEVAMLPPLTILKQQAKLNFAKPNADGFSLTASLDPAPGFSPANQMLHLDVGGAVFDLTLDEKGSGRTAQGSVKVALNKTTGQWTLTAKFKAGSWQDAWADDGLVNANEPKPGISVNLPAVVTIGDKAFGGERSLIYTATAGKSGSAK